MVTGSMDRKANGSPSRNIIAAAVIVAAGTGAGFLAGRDSVRLPEPIVATRPAAPVAVAVPEPTVAEVTLGRADILRMASLAADAASGEAPVADTMDGRRFVIRIPFGCGPTTAAARDRSATYTVAGETLRVRIQPQDWTALPWVASEVARREAVGAEGFWVPRPWTTAETCPPDAAEPADPSSSLGIAQLFDADSSRVGQRRGRALEATVQVDAEEADFSKGFKLVVEGRVAQWPGGRETVLCRAPTAYQRPVCLVGAKLDGISIENAANGERLADWRL